MEASVRKSDHLKGMEFLLKESMESLSYTPEDFSEEHKMIKQSVDDFVSDRVIPNSEDIEKQLPGLNIQLMNEMGALGLLSAHMPESYGGMGMDFISNSLIAEGMGRAGSFSVSYNAHTGIGMLPILYFGSEAQKQHYLPLLSTGELKASYCLTEPSSGSDALAAKTRADLSVDGKQYILNGQKMWITNAGFADIFIVFAQIDGNKFTGFIVDRNTKGLSIGEEEDKLGIKGSSTRQVYFENCPVPVENILGEIGKGHLIAFNVLNIGRYKLGLSCLGGCKNISSMSIQYANDRKQFGRAISDFGAIKRKLAEQAVRTYALESASYRLAGMMDSEISELSKAGKSYGESKLEAAEEYALECSIIKILGSEVLDYVVDEAVQIHGGMGYSEEGLIARAYRDSRINRIFEGTNEINRLLIMNMILKKAMKGEFDIASKAVSVQQELMSGAMQEDGTDWKYKAERSSLRSLKKILFMLLGILGQKAMSGASDLKEMQEPLMDLSDIIIEIFCLESVLLRVEKGKGGSLETDILKVLFQTGSQKISALAYEITGSIVDESMYPAIISGIRKYSKYPMQDLMSLRRNIADRLVESNSYSL